MPKKSKSSKRSPLVTISIIAIILLGLIIGVTYLYVAEVEHGSVSTLFFEMRTNRKLDENKSAKDLVSYTLPSGWIENNNVSYLTGSGDVLLTSADYIDNVENYPNRDGARITLGTSPKLRLLTIAELKLWYANGDSSNYTDVVIDGIPGLKWENSSTYHSYLFIKGDYMISVDASILAEDMTTEEENQYWKDMNSIINSIQFK